MGMQSLRKRVWQGFQNAFVWHILSTPILGISKHNITWDGKQFLMSKIIKKNMIFCYFFGYPTYMCNRASPSQIRIAAAATKTRSLRVPHTVHPGCKVYDFVQWNLILKARAGWPSKQTVLLIECQFRASKNWPYIWKDLTTTIEMHCTIYTSYGSAASIRCLLFLSWIKGQIGRQELCQQILQGWCSMAPNLMKNLSLIMNTVQTKHKRHGERGRGKSKKVESWTSRSPRQPSKNSSRKRTDNIYIWYILGPKARGG